MNKNDKLIVIIGVLILVVASIGIYTWKPADTMASASLIDEFFYISSSFSDIPDAIAVSDSDPFYALIATPLGVHYNDVGEQEVIPLYIKNFDNPSESVERAEEQIGITVNEFIDDTNSAEEWSLEIAKKYWIESDAVLLIENNESGYNLGVVATPLASYLSIPVIIADELNPNVREVLNELGVKKTLVCGQNIDGYGSVLRFENVKQIVNATIKLLMEKFGTIDYITLTNPIDAWPPKVLDRTEKHFGPVTMTTRSMTQLATAVPSMVKGSSLVGTFKIPNDYKYALVKFTGENLDCEDVDEFGDSVSFNIGIDDENEHPGRQNYEIYTGSTRTGGVAIRDSNGKVIRDIVYTENVLYDRGGAEYSIYASGTWLTKKEGRASANVVIEKLEEPAYALMKGLSTMAPYLTAYRQGIIFAKPEFAFTADDHVITDNGETLPGPYTALRNIGLIKESNEHVIEEIHDPLNDLLAKIARIDLEDERDIKQLREHYKNNPINIALVGGAVMIPQYYYDNYNQIVDVEEGQYYYGSGTPSDVLYGNIDPIDGDWSNEANDVYSEFPFQENIVGRITGYDSQDASAQIARTVFYDEIINELGNWKDTFGLAMGGGCDFRKPPLRYLLFGEILGIVRHGEPIKYFTGCSEMAGERTKELVAKPLGFEVEEAWEEEAQRVGFSEQALDEIKQLTLLNKIFFRQHLVRDLVGENVAKGGELMESSNFVWANGHGSQHLFGMAATRLVASGFGNILVRKLLEQTLPIFMGGFIGPGSSFSDLGDYSTRSCADMKMGPSFYWIESCICGKIDGLYPKNSVGQAVLHSGVAALVAASTTSNIAGGYLEPKNGVYDTGFSVLRAYIKAKSDARNGIYPDPHFGYKIYNDVCENLKEKDCSVGLALRNAKNGYLHAEKDWLVWWSPPLVSTGDPTADYEIHQSFQSTARSQPEPMMKNKYTSYQEYILFADPAFNPYEPINEGRQ